MVLFTIPQKYIFDDLIISINGLEKLTPEKIEEIAASQKKLAEEKNIGKRSKQFRLHDWCASRQRYWGCPVPIVLINE